MIYLWSGHLFTQTFWSKIDKFPVDLHEVHFSDDFSQVKQSSEHSRHLPSLKYLLDLHLEHWLLLGPEHSAQESWHLTQVF